MHYRAYEFYPRDSHEFVISCPNQNLPTMTITTTPRSLVSRSAREHTTAAAIVVALTGALQAQPIAVPNSSFESQPAPNVYPFVNVFVDSWQKAPEPDYYGPAIGTPFGIPWIGTAGVFLDVNPYVNRIGSQAGYILGFPD